MESCKITRDCRANKSLKCLMRILVSPKPFLSRLAFGNSGLPESFDEGTSTTDDLSYS